MIQMINTNRSAFDRRNLYYYIDDDGYFVIRFNGPDYDYNTVGPK